MNWILGSAAPVLVVALFLATGRATPTIVGYHLFCAAIVFAFRARIRPLLRWDAQTARWAAGVSLPVVAFLLAAPMVASPAPYKELFLKTVFPDGSPARLFPAFAAYSLLIHSPLEEIAWRAGIMDPGRAGLRSAAAGNALFFGLLHAVPLGIVLGWRGFLAGLPTAAAGALWALVTIRSRSLWPSLLSHAAADALILAGMWFFFIR